MLMCSKSWYRRIKLNRGPVNKAGQSDSINRTGPSREANLTMSNVLFSKVYDSAHAAKP
jgi:hypothetical protein